MNMPISVPLVRQCIRKSPTARQKGYQAIRATNIKQTDLCAIIFSILLKFSKADGHYFCPLRADYYVNNSTKSMALKQE